MLEILGNIGFDWRVALANFVNFLVIFYILKRFAFGPIQKMISEREETIKGGIENAEKAKAELVMAKEQKKAIVIDARKKANEIITAATTEEKAIIEAASKRAIEKTDEIIAEGRSRMKREQAEAEAVLRAQAVDLIVAGTEKVLKREMTQEKNEAFIKSIVQG
jgi:F-type H+-transporting ATPase subunit b